MAVPRPLLLIILGTVLLAATFLATRNARDQAAEDTSQPPAQKLATPAPAPEKAEKSRPRADKTEAASKAGAGKSRATAKSRAGRARDRAARPRRTAAVAAMPAQVRRAIARNRVVVLFLYQRGASDDRRVARALASLRGRTRAAIFSDRIANLARYSAIVTGIGVTRAPSIVIVGKDGRGRLIDGFIDSEALAQSVADAG